MNPNEMTPRETMLAECDPSIDEMNLEVVLRERPVGFCPYCRERTFECECADGG